MKRGKKKWVLPVVGAAGLLLAVYGIGSEWASAREKDAPMAFHEEASQKEKPIKREKTEETENNEEIHLVYDASARARGTPMRDPFSYGNGKEEKRNIEKENAQDSKKGQVKKEGKENKKTSRTEEEAKEKEAPRLPVLRGIFKIGTDRRAMIDYDGSVHLVKEGEQLSTWTVSSIGEKAAVLTGVQSALYLTLQ